MVVGAELTDNPTAGMTGYGRWSMCSASCIPFVRRAGHASEPTGDRYNKLTPCRILTRADKLRASQFPSLTERLGQDLDEQLPKRGGKRCRAVVFLDTFEDLAGGEQNEA